MKNIMKLCLGLSAIGMVACSTTTPSEPGYGNLTPQATWGQCVKCDLQGANLAGLNIERANLSEANLSGANLEKTNLERVELPLDYSLPNLYMVLPPLSPPHL